MPTVKSTAKISARKVSNGWAEPYSDFPSLIIPRAGAFTKGSEGSDIISATSRTGKPPLICTPHGGMTAFECVYDDRAL